jgi:hypothetical protein
VAIATSPVPRPPGPNFGPTLVAVAIWAAIIALSWAVILLTCHHVTVRLVGLPGQQFCSSVAFMVTSIALQVALEWRWRHIARAARHLHSAAREARRRRDSDDSSGPRGRPDNQ